MDHSQITLDMIWTLKYSWDEKDRVALFVVVDVPGATTFKQVRRWWRSSQYARHKLRSGRMRK